MTIRCRAGLPSSQPIIGNADYPQDLYLASGAELVGEPEVDETGEVAWVPVDETPAMIARGDILGRSPSSGCSMPCCGGQPLAYLRCDADRRDVCLRAKGAH
jgi:hypothetical protein